MRKGSGRIEYLKSQFNARLALRILALSMSTLLLVFLFAAAAIGDEEGDEPILIPSTKSGIFLRPRVQQTVSPHDQPRQPTVSLTPDARYFPSPSEMVEQAHELPLPSGASGLP